MVTSECVTLSAEIKCIRNHPYPTQTGMVQVKFWRAATVSLKGGGEANSTFIESKEIT